MKASELLCFLAALMKYTFLLLKGRDKIFLRIKIIRRFDIDQSLLCSLNIQSSEFKIAIGCHEDER
jgi:hypothetical protein